MAPLVTTSLETGKLAGPGPHVRFGKRPSPHWLAHGPARPGGERLTSLLFTVSPITKLTCLMAIWAQAAGFSPCPKNHLPAPMMCHQIGDRGKGSKTA